MEEHRELAGYKSQASKPLDYSKGVRCHLPSAVFPRFFPDCDWVYRGARQVFSTIKFPDHVILYSHRLWATVTAAWTEIVDGRLRAKGHG